MDWSLALLGVMAVFGLLFLGDLARSLYDRSASQTLSLIIIFVLHNMENQIEFLLRSFYRCLGWRSRAGPCRLVAIDDHSTDSTGRIISRLAREGWLTAIRAPGGELIPEEVADIPASDGVLFVHLSQADDAARVMSGLTRLITDRAIIPYIGRISRADVEGD
ncbi:MAG: hypothetical protein AB1331_02340 [Bacillota bacterium]